MVAELGAIYHSKTFFGTGVLEKQKSSIYLSRTRTSVLMRVAGMLNIVELQMSAPIKKGLMVA